MSGPHDELPESDPEKDALSPGDSYQQILDRDSREVPEVLRWRSARELPVVRVPIERYVSQEFHDLEMEKLWKRVWQMACREEVVAEPGDHAVYEIGDTSIVVVRGNDQRIRAFHNVCLHRGRRLKDTPGRSGELRCAFHGWSWNLDGTPREVPCKWDFPHAEREEFGLPEVRVGTWGGFVFVNLDPDCIPLEQHLGELPLHFDDVWPMQDRYTEAHVAHLMPCNWKVVQEAFMEAYHVIATHPQLLQSLGDCNSQYDAWDTFSRALTPQMVPSPHLTAATTEQEMLDSFLLASIDGPPPISVPENMTAREVFAQMMRMNFQASVPSVQRVSDAELNDSIYYTLFPNFHPWGGYTRVTYRFRPFENDPNRSIMEVFLLSPFRGTRPSPAPVHWLDFDEPWTEAPELGSLANIFAQDTFNLPNVQRGLRAASHEHVTLARYQETKLRHFHTLLEKYVNA
jgi:phenylpropionate dioxygenase-like ring-hydroxylating dioxygenase large terminal subunit